MENFLHGVDREQLTKKELVLGRGSCLENAILCALNSVSQANGKLKTYWANRPRTYRQMHSNRRLSRAVTGHCPENEVILSILQANRVVDGAIQVLDILRYVNELTHPVGDGFS